MTPEMNMTYESFIRGAFSVNEEHLIDRWGDLAGLADTDMFSYGEIEKVKSAVSYSMEIYRSHIINNCSPISAMESDDMDRIVRDVINGPNKTIIFELIREFREKYSDKYVIYRWNK